MSSKASEAFALKSLRELARIGASAFITSVSCGPEKRYEVVAKFRTLEESSAFHQAMIDCGRAVREMDEKEEAGDPAEKPSPKAKGPFGHGTGGGKRNIRGTNSLT